MTIQVRRVGSEDPHSIPVHQETLSDNDQAYDPNNINSDTPESDTTELMPLSNEEEPEDPPQEPDSEEPAPNPKITVKGSVVGIDEKSLRKKATDLAQEEIEEKSQSRVKLKYTDRTRAKAERKAQEQAEKARRKGEEVDVVVEDRGTLWSRIKRAVTGAVRKQVYGSAINRHHRTEQIVNEANRTGGTATVNGETRALLTDQEKVAIASRTLKASQGSDFEKELLHEGEQLQSVQDERINALVTEFVHSNIGDKEFELRLHELNLQIKSEHPELFDEDVDIIATNLLESAKQARSMVLHNAGMAAAEIETEVILGRALSGVRTEIEYDRLGKILDKLQKTAGVKYIFQNETTAAIAAAAIGIGMDFAGPLARGGMKLAGVTTFGLSAAVGGLTAKGRRSNEITENMQHHSRQMAEGQDFDPQTSPHRQKIEQYRHETISSQMLTDSLSRSLEQLQDTELSSAERLTHARDLLDAISHARARIILSDMRDIDLIRYGGSDQVEQDRFDLDLMVANSKMQLRQMLESNPELKSLLLGEHEDLDSLFDERLEEETLLLLHGNEERGVEGIEQRERNFEKMRKKESWKAFAKGFGVGLLVGATAQEILAAATPGRVGLVETMFGGAQGTGEKVTALKGLSEFMSGGPKTRELFTLGSGGSLHEIIGPDGALDGKVNLPDGTHLIQGPNGHYSLISADTEWFNDFGSQLEVTGDGKLTEQAHELLESGGGKELVTDVTFTDDGHLSETAINQLEQQYGASITDSQIKIGEEITTREVPMHDYVMDKLNSGEAQKLHRLGWLDYDTEFSERNELRLGVTRNTDGSTTVWFHPTRDAVSFGDGTTVNVKDAIEQQNLSFFVAPERIKTPEGWVGFEIKPTAYENGIASHTFPPGDAMGDFLNHEGPDGLGPAKGTLEAMVRTGTDADGSGNFYAVATERGADVDVPMIETSTKDIMGTMTEIDGITVENPYIIELPPVIPILGREMLEPTKQSEPTPEPNPYVYNYLGPPSERDLEGRYVSERLRDDPNARLNFGEESRDYFESLPEEYRKEVEQAALESAPMSRLSTTSVVIPVNGAQEGPNIYQTLQGYTHQTDTSGKPLDPGTYEVVLFVNHPDDVEPDNTLQEIRRFQRDYPDVPIRVIYKKPPREQANIGQIRKFATDVVIRRAQMRGEEDDLTIISNDADNVGISPRYISNMSGKLGNGDEGVDGVLGKLDWDPRAYAISPKLLVGERMTQYLDALIRHLPERGDAQPSQSGTNTPEDITYTESAGDQTRSIGSSGASFAFRGSTYCAVGGYRGELKIAEDVGLGRDFEAARAGGDNYPIAYGGAGTELYTSARRSLGGAISKGLAPVLQWRDDFTADDRVRDLSPSEIYDRLSELEPSAYDRLDNPDYQSGFRASIEEYLMQTFRVYNLSLTDDDKGGKLVRRTMGFLGIRYKLVDDPEGIDGKRIEITDMSRLINGLKRFQRNGLEIFKRKIGQVAVAA